MLRSSWNYARRTVPILIGAIVAACAGGKGPQLAEPSPEAVARLEVVNRSASDMDIYLVHAGQRSRLGLAPSSETTRFTLAPAQLAGVGMSHFEAVPLLATTRPVHSDPTKVRLGDVITFDVPPP